MRIPITMLLMCLALACPADGNTFHARFVRLTLSATQNRGTLNFQYEFRETATNRPMLINRKIVPWGKVQGTDTTFMYSLGVTDTSKPPFATDRGREYDITLTPLSDEEMARLLPSTYYATNCKLSGDSIVQEYIFNTPLSSSPLSSPLADIDGRLYTVTFQPMVPADFSMEEIGLSTRSLDAVVHPGLTY